MKLSVVEGVQAQMGLDVGVKGWIQQQVPSWENATIGTYLCSAVFTSSILGALPCHVRAARVAFLFEPFVDTYIVRSQHRRMPSSASVHPLSFLYERQLKEILHQL